MKYPWLAALLNLIPSPVGFGYLYLGKTKRAFAVHLSGWGATWGMGIAAILSYVPCVWGGDCATDFLIAIFLILFFVVPVGFLIYGVQDAWRIANRLNKQSELG